MSNIYQEIWNADQSQNGVEPILSIEEGSQEQGYVKVNADLDASSDPDLKVLEKLHIPSHKMTTYNLCRKLFNNFSLAEPMPEFDTPEERQEVHDFLTAIVDTEPMEVARQYIERESNSVISKERWHNTLMEMWFRRFSSGGDPELSGFEHVVVGEQEKSKVQGYHFWWKYYLDDGFAPQVDDGMQVPTDSEFKTDRIRFHGSKQKTGQLKFPESVTISYRWHAPDYDANAYRPLFKKIGGFFVGCSVEGLMALGTVRAHKGVRAPSVAVIEGAKYDMKLFHSPNGQHIRTFYPIFLGAADPSNGGNGDDVIPDDNLHLSPIRIISAMVNPADHDVGFETISLVNVSPDKVSVENWSLRDKNNKRHVIDDRMMDPGSFYTIRLDGTTVQLSNKGGEILLLNSHGEQMQKVVYSKKQARQQGATVLF
nr:lamin tail domain-containing protein [uncultured Desulfobacter sp.]